MRINYSDDEDFDGQFDLWQANCQRSLQGKAGQAALKRLEAALVAMPDKRLIKDKLVNNKADVCAIGALARADGKLPEPESFDDEEDENDTAEFATAHLNVPRLVAWKVVEMNDHVLDTVWEVGHGPLKRHETTYKGGIALIREMTPEERYEKMLAWVRAHLS